MTPETAHDVVVIGSGCTGGTAAWQLCRRGLRVLLLEAGNPVAAKDSHTDPGVGTTLRRLWRVLMARRQQTQSLHPAYWLYPPKLFVDDKKHPYSTTEGRPFVWIRGRQVGGRSLTWTGVSLRLSPYELADWPLSYEDLAPHYDEIEELMGVCGGRDHLPQLPDGNYRSERALTPAEIRFKDRIAARWPQRRLIVSRGIEEAAAGTWSSKTSLGSTLEAARRTGLLEVRAGSIARRVLVDAQTGVATGVEVIDSQTSARTVVPARALVVCASALESVRLLMNSRSAAFPDGLGNSTGLLGRYVMNKVSRSVTFEMPSEGNDTVHPISAAHSFVIPRYENLASEPGELRGGFGVWGAIQRIPAPRRTDASAAAQAFGLMVGYGECLPYFDNALQLKEDVLDAWGVPTLHVDVRWRENEQRMAARIESDLRQMVDAAGGTVVAATASSQRLRHYLTQRVIQASTVPGAFVHEMGGARMGRSAADSVVNEHCQLWDAPNVLVTDGACWPSSGWQNPTLTMMAVTARSCSFLAGALQRGEL